MELSMSVDVSVAALRVADEAFLVSSMIERCPKTMMIRELVVNAIEAASRAQGDKRVTIMSQLISGVSKLCIRNTGPGLSATELDQICDLASTLHKVSGLDANFGMGAKVASLPSNKHGMRYRSCKNGVVSEVILCQREGVYGRLRRTVGTAGNFAEVVDATPTCHEEVGYDLSFDWTEVVLFGNHTAQNTVLDPYAGNPPSAPNWLFRNLLMRFFRLPAEVVIEVEAGEPEGAYRRFTTLGERLGTIGQCETVRTASGISIHYLYAPPGTPSTLPRSEDLTSLGGLGCIVYKGEIYDVRAGPTWTLDAPSFGISFGANCCAIFIELPDDYLVRPEAYRQFLRFRGGDQRQVFVRDYAALVRSSMPVWLVKIIRALGPSQSKFVDDVEDEMRDLLAELGVEARFSGGPPALPANKPQPVAQTASTVATVAPSAASKPPVAREPPPKRYERPAEIISLDSDELIEERGLKGRAAKYYPTSHQLFVNLKYAAVTLAAEHLEREFIAAIDPERMRAVAQNIAGWIVTRKIARSLAHSLAKKAAGWPVDDIARAQSPESFSLVADDWLMVIDSARARMEGDLGSDWQTEVTDFVEPHVAAEAA
jgi:hypothetical protein